jgi:hypothetical protein
MSMKTDISYPMAPHQLEIVCLGLFGDSWKGYLSENLNVTRRTVNFWASGQVKIPGAVVFALALVSEKKERKAA